MAKFFVATLAVVISTAAPGTAQPDAKDGEITSKTFPAIKLVRIPAKGKQFTMGAPKGEPGQRFDETEHSVTLTADFYLAVVPVTRGQFAAFVKETGYVTDPEKGGKGLGWDPVKKEFVEGGKFDWRKPGFEQTDEHPVVKTSWNDAMAFCKWLGKKDGREYRLPTEAQWEFACRAGTKTRYSFGDDGEQIVKHANVADAKFREVTGNMWGIKDNDGYAFTCPVGLFRKNAFGLQDMHGNTKQWCSDVFADYPREAVTDPEGPEAKGEVFRVLRGGCWRNEPIYGRSASRKSGEQNDAGIEVGFRLAASVGK
jgi:formylglycine-generating enzyme required for sulfatase activity